MSADELQESGPYGRGGHRPAAVEMSFFGRLGPVFVAFAKARADRLSLKGWIEQGGNRIRAHVEGPEALVGAFEMACCIGPEQSTVNDWICKDVVADEDLCGFSIRSREAGRR